jgi:hydroxyacylglutathione hydrolase
LIKNIHTVAILRDNYCFLIEGPDQTCVIVDPGEVTPVEASIKTLGLTPTLILNTHHHADHVAGNKALKELYKISVAAPETELSRIPHADISLKPGDIAAFDLEVLFTPGHTNGHISFHSPSYHALLCGDVLFSMGCGRVLEGTHEDLYNSLQLLKTLPLNTKIYCGHEYTQSNGAFALTIHPSNSVIQARMEDVRKLRSNNLPTLPVTLETELQTNPFLMAESLEEFKSLRDKKDRF